MEALYEECEVERVLCAYKRLFPTPSHGLEAYWGWNRERPWSYLTTDFHQATYSQFRLLHDRIRAIDATKVSLTDRSEALKMASRECNVGFSMGICPWTDSLLLQTYAPEKDQLTILLGHDWYPMASEGEEHTDSPLNNGDTLQQWPNYIAAVPTETFNASTVGLFLNLYPDFRAAGAGKCGVLQKCGIGYDECVLGLDEVIEAVSTHFRTVRMVSWGAHVWKALRSRVHGVPPRGLMAHIGARKGEIMRLELAGRVIPYFPIAHPSHPGNFRRTSHLEHLIRGFESMRVLPG